MRKIFLLVKTLMKSGEGMASGGKRKSKAAIPIVLAIAFISFAGPMALVTSGIYDALAYNSVDTGIILSLVFGATCAVIFIFGVIYVISVMYHAADIELLSYLPIKPYEILSAKFLTLVIYEYIFEAFILLPVVFEYGVKSGAGAAYIIYSVILLLITPFIALSMASVLVIILMRFTSFGKNKQAFKFVGGILALVFAIGLNIMIQTSVKDLTEGQMAAALQGSNLTSVFNNLFPGIGFASGALSLSGSLQGLVDLLLFILCSAAAYAVFVLVGQLLYLKGINGITEVSAKRKGIRDIRKETESSSALKAYVRKELRLLMRSPTAFLNCILMTFIWPVLLVVMFFGGGNGNLSMTLKSLPQASGSVVIAVLSGICAFISCANAITSTAISREGKSLYFTKYIPMSMKSQLNAKIIPGMIFSSISVVIIVLIGLVGGINIIAGITALAAGLVITAASSYVGLALDIANPKLLWVNEQQAIKQNINVILHMIIGVVLGGAAIVPPLLFNMSAVVTAVYEIAVFAVLLIILVRYAGGRGTDKLINMDV